MIGGISDDSDRERIRSTSDCAQPGIAVDRFARKIVGFLKVLYAARSRQLNAKPLAGGHQSGGHTPADGRIT